MPVGHPVLDPPIPKQLIGKGKFLQKANEHVLPNLVKLIALDTPVDNVANVDTVH